jgi:hypothetical protein
MPLATKMEAGSSTPQYQVLGRAVMAQAALVREELVRALVALQLGPVVVAARAAPEAWQMAGTHRTSRWQIKTTEVAL